MANMPGTPATRLITPELIKLGFEEVFPTESTIPRLICCTDAREKQGKTHWALTAPGPIGVISTDAGTREIMRKICGGKKSIYKSMARAKDLVSEKAPHATAEKAWLETRECMEAMVDNKSIRTIITDTCTEMWDLCRLARFGKLAQVLPIHYGPVNDEFRKVILKLPGERDGLNCIFIHKVKKEYRGKDGKDSWTGKLERAGFADAPYVADVVLRHYRKDLDPEDEDSAGKRCRFGIEVTDSRFEPESMIGLRMEGDDCNFQMLGFMAFPETDLEYWT